MFKMRIAAIAVGLVACHALSATAADTKQVEVMHWWTSGGEAKALTVLKDGLKTKGFAWKDSPIAGGGGEAARTVLKARVASGNPPDAIQMLGFTIPEYAQEDYLQNLDAVASKEGWDKLVPPPIQKISRPHGSFIRVSELLKYRLPRRVTRIPCTSSAGTRGRFTLRSVLRGKRSTDVIRRTSCTSTGRYVAIVSG